MERFSVNGGQMVLQRTERLERRPAVGTPFRGVPGGIASGARRQRRRFVPVAVAAHGRRFFEPRQVIVHVHLDLDIRDQRLSAYDARSGKSHLTAVHVDRVAVFLEVLVELVFGVDDHFTVTAHGTGRHLREKIKKKYESVSTFGSSSAHVLSPCSE